MKKKAIIRLGLFSISALIIVLISLIAFSGFFSSAVFEKDKYVLGEKVKIDLENYEGNVKIKTPSTSFLRKSFNDVFLFEPSEIGFYEVSLDNGGRRKSYTFEVVEYIQEEVGVENKDVAENVGLKKIDSIIDGSIKINGYNSTSKESFSVLDDSDEKVSDFEFLESENNSLDIIFSKRALKPGIYRVDIEGENYTKEFAYGLISLNTKKSIYYPYDEALFELVVLDKNGVGVCKAEINMQIKTPDGNTALISKDDEIVSGDECGLYYVKYNVSIEGEYFVYTDTKINEYEVNFYTSFLVDKEYEYEIVRETKSKIDPTQEDFFDVKINVKSLINDEKLEIKEYVPAVFEILGEGFEVETVGDTKVLTWIVKDYYAELNYSYSVPMVWPYLYKLGPIEVNDFKEFRSWYVAVDPIAVVDTQPSQDVAVAALDNSTYVVAWVDVVEQDISFRIFDANGTLLVNTVDVLASANLGTDARVAVSTVNSTVFIVGLDNGANGGQAAQAAGYKRDGTSWFGLFTVEASVSTPAVDIDITPMVDRYQVCLIDDFESDADVITYLYSAPTTISGAETEMDTGANPDTALHNLFECAAINATRFAAFWFDDSGDTAAYSIRDQNRVSITGQTNIDLVGLSGQVSVTSLNQDRFAMAYFNSTAQSIRISIRDRLNGVVLAPTTIDNNASTTGNTISRVATATVRNQTQGSDWFVVAWQDLNAGVINASVFNASGTNFYSYTLATDENTTSLLFDIYGYDSLFGGLCPETYVLSYTNNTNGIVAKTFRLDGSEWPGICNFTGPILTVHSPLNQIYNDSKVLFNVSSTNRGGVAFYSLDNGINNVSMTTPNNFTWNSTNYSIADGAYIVRFFVNDTNRYRNDTVNVSFRIDTTGPKIAIINPAYNVSNYSLTSITFNLTLNENASSCRYTLNSGALNYSMSNTTLLNWNATNASISNGFYTVKFYCNDTVNNWGTNSTTFRLDTVAPDAIIAHPFTTNYSVANLTLNFTVTDSGSGVAYCWRSLNNGFENVSIPNCLNTTVNISNQGFNTLNLYVNDSAGNLNKSVNVTFFVDSIKPLINFTYPTPENYTALENTYFLVNVTVNDDNFANITFELYNISFGGMYLVNRTTYTTLIPYINWTNLNDNFQNYTYNVSVWDIANNFNATETRNIRMIKDIIFPAIYIDYPLNYQNYSTNVSELNYSVIENHPQSCWYSINYGVINSTHKNAGLNFTFITSLEGNNVWTLYCNDTAGNTNYTNVSFFKDTAAPSFNVSSPVFGNNYNYTNILLNLSLDDISQTYTWYNWNGTNYTYSSADYVNFSDGNITLNIWANDSLGNLNFTQVNFTVFVPINFAIYSVNGMLINSTTQILREFNGLFDLQVNLTNEDADFIYFYGYNKTSNSSFIFSSTTNETFADDSFAFSPQGMVFNYTNISLIAASDYLYKCYNWNMENLTCLDISDWEIIRLNTIGERFNLTLNSTDPGFLFLNVSGEDILKDGYALQSSPANEWGARTYMVVSNYTNGNAHSLIAFNISDIPSEVNIGNATLTLYCSAETLEGGESILVKAHGVYSSFSWSEGTGVAGNACTGDEYCWNNRPGAAQYNLTEDSSLVIPDGCAGKNYSFSVTSSVAYAYANSYNNISLYLTPNGTNVGTVTNDEVRFATRQFATSYVRPKLNITYFTIPRVNITSPLSDSYYNYTMQVTIRSNVTDRLVNISAVIANITLPNGTINQFILQNFSGGIYEYNFTETNLLGRYNITIVANNTDRYINDSEKTWFYVTDYVYPLINFTYPTEQNNSYLLRNWALVNVTANDTYLSNITIYLFNNLEIINATFSNLSNFYVNFTDLADGQYYLNASACDTSNNCNYTETRNFFVDFSYPVMYIDYPLSYENYSTNVSELNYSIIDISPQYCWYSTNYGVSNSTHKNAGLNFTFITSVEGNNVWTLYCNDTAGNTNYTNVSFIKDTIYPLIDYSFGTNVNFANISSDSIFVNSTVVEDNFANITFELYNFTSGLTLVNITTFYDGNRSINWSNLNDGNYSYNVTVTDIVNHINSTETRYITLDKTNPLAILSSPYDFALFNYSLQNLTVNITDNILIENATLKIINSTNNTINITTRLIYSNDSSLGVVFDFPYDGNFSWYYEIRDTANNINLTENRSLSIDLTRPNLLFIDPTLGNNSEYEGNYVYANVSVFEPNFANITFEIYNNTGGATLINSTTFSDERKEINWSDLNSANITYYYFASAYDIVNNINYTETRTIKLVDKTLPYLSLIEPINKTYFFNTSIPITFIASDVNLDSCWYSVDQVENITLPDCLDNEFNVSEGGHTFYIYANDTLGLTSTAYVIFNSNISQFVPYGGILGYGEGTIQIPRYRIWSGTGFSSEINASAVVSTIEWLRVKPSHSRDEYMLVTADVGDNIMVQINSTLSNGATCWHNGSTCDSTLEVETLSSPINRLKADVSYESKGDDALVVWTQLTGSPGYRVWNGTSWNSEGIIPQTKLGNNITFVKMESHPFREEIALIMSNTTDLDIIIWNGSEWGCELNNNVGLLTPDLYQHADLAYEQKSGDLFVANNFDSATLTQINYTTKQDGSCTYVSDTTTTLLEESEIISVGARYGSDHIMISQEDIGGNDMHSIVWNGSTMLSVSGNEQTLYAETSPNQLIATGWAGTSDKGLVVYSDTVNSLNLDYFRYNISNDAWEDNGGNGYDATGITGFSNEEQNIFAYSYIDENKTLVIVQDDDDDLWAKSYNADSNVWAQPDNGAALETTVSATSFPSFDFAFNYDRFGPQIRIVKPDIYYQNTSNVLFNLSLGERTSSCSYLIDNLIGGNMPASSTREYYGNQSGLSEGLHTVVFNCTDVKDNYRDVSTNFIVDTINPLINFTYSTENNASSFERDWIFVNVSVIETNFANITFELYNITGGVTLVNSTTFTDGNRSINWTGLGNSTYAYNVSVRDLANNFNATETRIIYFVRESPIIYLQYPSNFLNITGYNVSMFNFSVYDESSLINCSLYGNWTNEWRINDTLFNLISGNLSFSSKIMLGDGYYTWNVYCIDRFNNTGFNSTNFTFSTFMYPDYPVYLNISQDNDWGRGNITLFWNSSNHSIGYRVYYSTNLSNFVFLNETINLNYTDNSFIGSIRRFYRIDAFNPVGQNSSSDYFGTHVYTFNHNGNTKNLVGFPTNASYLTYASDTLYSIHNATAFNMWNTTIQKRITCNKYSCPTFPSCTGSNCDFNFPAAQGLGYEVYVNSTMPNSFNWSMVGIVYNRSVINLIKNSTDFGKNWIGLYANTSLVNAANLIQNITYSDAVSNWNTQQQTSQGLIPNPFGAGYLGNNFALLLEKGYEISVTQSVNWTQI